MASYKTNTPCRPTFAPEPVPADSKMACVLKLAKDTPTPLYKKFLVKMGHRIITGAKSMKDLGFSEKTAVDAGSGFMVANDNNTMLAHHIFVLDKGLFAHLLNKVTKLITTKVIPNKDHLCIMNWPYEWVHDSFTPYTEDGEILIDNQTWDAEEKYASVMLN
jgi:hypothetical protein